MEKSMPFLEHLVELRRRIIASLIAVGIGFIIGYFTFPFWSRFLLAPLTQLQGSATPIALSMAESFIAQIKYSLILGVLYASPFLAFHGIRFIMPALKPKESRALIALLFVGSILFFGGIYYCYELILPLCIDFFASVSQALGIQQEYRYSENLAFILQVILAFGFMFQCPVILFILMMLGLVTRETLLKNSRAIIIGAFVISAFITPPDIISQVLLALPLLVLFFLSIGIAWICRIG